MQRLFSPVGDAAAGWLILGRSSASGRPGVWSVCWFLAAWLVQQKDDSWRGAGWRQAKQGRPRTRLGSSSRSLEALLAGAMRARAMQRSRSARAVGCGWRRPPRHAGGQGGEDERGRGGRRGGREARTASGRARWAGSWAAGKGREKTARRAREDGRAAVEKRSGTDGAGAGAGTRQRPNALLGWLVYARLETKGPEGVANAQCTLVDGQVQAWQE